MKWTEMSAGLKNGADQRLWNAFGENAEVIAKRICEDTSFAPLLGEIITQVYFSTVVFQATRDRARVIMGKNFFGIEESMKYFDTPMLSSEELEKWYTVPWSETTLMECKDTHILVFVTPISISQICEKFDASLFNGRVANKESNQFEKLENETGWYLVQKSFLTNSGGKSFEEQKKCLDEHQEVPTMQTMFYAILCYYLKTKTMLFRGQNVRCRELIGTGISSKCSTTGCFHGSCIDIHYTYPDDAITNLGLAVMRKKEF